MNLVFSDADIGYNKTNRYNFDEVNYKLVYAKLKTYRFDPKYFFFKFFVTQDLNKQVRRIN